MPLLSSAFKFGWFFVCFFLSQLLPNWLWTLIIFSFFFLVLCCFVFFVSVVCLCVKRTCAECVKYVNHTRMNQEWETVYLFWCKETTVWNTKKNTIIWKEINFARMTHLLSTFMVYFWSNRMVDPWLLSFSALYWLHVSLLLPHGMHRPGLSIQLLSVKRYSHLTCRNEIYLRQHYSTGNELSGVKTFVFKNKALQSNLYGIILNIFHVAFAHFINARRE